MLLRRSLHSYWRATRVLCSSRRSITDGAASLRSLNEDIQTLANMHRVYEENEEKQAAVKEASHALASTISSTGSVFTTGVGKAGVVAQRFAKSLCSISVPTQWVHGSEWVHGDLGNIQAHDVVVVISNSGKSQELLDAVALLPSRGAQIISVVGDIHSPVTFVLFFLCKACQV